MAPKKRNKTSGKSDAGKIKSLKLKKETVRDLSVEDARQVKGGLGCSVKSDSDTCRNA
jgi:hypothetical protein